MEMTPEETASIWRRGFLGRGSPSVGPLLLIDIFTGEVGIALGGGIVENIIPDMETNPFDVGGETKGDGVITAEPPANETYFVSILGTPVEGGKEDSLLQVSLAPL
jgi:hypothetical protein